MILNLARRALRRKWIVGIGLVIMTCLAVSGALAIYRYVTHPVRGDQYILVTSNQYHWPEDHIFAMLPDGSHLTRIAKGFDPSCSPDGRRIAFAAPVGFFQPDGRDPYTQIFVMDADGSNVTQLTFADDYNDSPVWSPDSRYLAYEGIGKIAIVDVNSWKAVYPVSQNWLAHDPAWSPDGQQLLVFAFPAGRYEERGLYVMSVDSSNIIQLTSGYDVEPDWSPDGARIVFVHDEGGMAPRSLRIINADGSNPVDVLTLTKGELSSPRWSPDGQHITFVQEHDGVFAINADGSGLTPLIEPGQQVWGAEGGFIPMRRFVFLGGVDWCEVR